MSIILDLVISEDTLDTVATGGDADPRAGTDISESGANLIFEVAGEGI